MEVRSSTGLTERNSTGLTKTANNGTTESAAKFEELLLRALSSDKAKEAAAAEDSAAGADSETSIVGEVQDDTLTADTADAEQSEETAEAGAETPEDYAVTFLRGLVGSVMVNEEQLYRGIIEQKLRELKPEAADFFVSAVAKDMARQAAEEPYTTEEEAAKQALRETVAAGLIDQAAAEQINGQAFAAAQLDDNLEELYDSRGSEEDPSIAVADLRTAFAKASGVLDKLKAGELTVAPRPLDELPDNIQGWGIESGLVEAPEEAEGGEEQEFEEVEHAERDRTSQASPVPNTGGSIITSPEVAVDPNQVTPIPELTENEQNQTT